MKKKDQETIKTDRSYVTILGIRVLSTTTTSVLTGVREKVSRSYEYSSRNYKFSIVTPNPELVLASMNNKELRVALNSASYSIPDGVGLNFASRFIFGSSINIIPGRILFEKLIELANKLGWKVFFLGGKGIEAQKAAENLQKNYKNIKIETFSGPRLNYEAEPVTDSDKLLQREALQLINKFSPQLLFVAFGNPKQEIWVYKNLRYLNIGGAMSVGGTFRYIAGISPLPPKWMEQAGLEWLYRLVTEPYRIVRVFRAVVVFPLTVCFSKLKRM